MAGELSIEQIAEIKEAFDIFDYERKGVITRDSLTTVLWSIGEEPNRDLIDHMLKTSDFDGEDGVSFPEFLSILSWKLRRGDQIRECHRKELEAELRAAFDIFVPEENEQEKDRLTIEDLKRTMKNLNVDLPDDKAVE